MKTRIICYFPPAPPLDPKTVAWRKLCAIFDTAADLPPRERPRFLDQECRGDSALRQEVEQLLEAFERCPNWLCPASEAA